MTKLIKAVIAIVILSFAGILFFKLSQIINNRKQIALTTRKQPTLPFVKFINKDYIEKNNNSIIIIFDSECEHCQYEIKQIKDNYKSFANSNIYMLSTQNLNTIIDFSKKNNLGSFDRINLGSISQEQLYKIFGHTVVPHIFVYGSNHKLKSEFKGEIRIESLIARLD